MLAIALAAALSCAAREPSVTLVSRAAPAPGEAVLVVVEGQPKNAPPRGTLAGRALRFSPARHGAYAALAGFDLDESTGSKRLEVELTGAVGVPHYWTQEVVVEPKAYPTQEVSVEQKYVTPPKEDEERAEAESKMLRGIYAHGAQEELFHGAFRAPIPKALSSHFGERRVFNGVPKSPHAGADLRAKKGAPVKAPAGGSVAVARDLFYSGNTVILDHGLGLFTIYAHLSRVDVRTGQKVKAGARLGLVGATGRVSGPHLHWGVRLDGARVDPFCLVDLPLAKYF